MSLRQRQLPALGHQRRSGAQEQWRAARGALSLVAASRRDEWVQYTWKKPVTLKSARVYWFDDTGRGACRLPASWQIEYRDGEQWKPVAAPSEYAVKKDAWCAVNFTPVTTTALRLAVEASGPVGRGRPRMEGRGGRRRLTTSVSRYRVGLPIPRRSLCSICRLTLGIAQDGETDERVDQHPAGTARLAGCISCRLRRVSEGRSA